MNKETRPPWLAPAAANQPWPVTPVTLAELGRLWLSHKAAEKAANAARIAIEAEITVRVNDGRLSGTSTAEDGPYTVKVERKLDRKLDMEALVPVLQAMPEEVTERLLRAKYEVVAAELKWLEANRPELFSLASKAIIEKPAKPAVSVVVRDGPSVA